MKRGVERKLGTISVLCKYFGKSPGQSGTEFMEEMKVLSNNEQLELAQEAARSLGLTKSQVRFDLS